jgi:hypothetical protein
MNEHMFASPTTEERLLQGSVLRLLLLEHPGQFTYAELERELTAPRSRAAGSIEEAVTALVGAGLVNRTGEMLGASRAAVAFDALEID